MLLEGGFIPIDLVDEELGWIARVAVRLEDVVPGLRSNCVCMMAQRATQLGFESGPRSELGIKCSPCAAHINGFGSSASKARMMSPSGSTLTCEGVLKSMTAGFSFV